MVSMSFCFVETKLKRNVQCQGLRAAVCSGGVQRQNDTCSSPILPSKLTGNNCDLVETLAEFPPGVFNIEHKPSAEPCRI
jgi:hypothetical protein